MQRLWSIILISAGIAGPVTCHAQKISPEDDGARLLKDCSTVADGHGIGDKEQIAPAFMCIGFMRGLIEMNMNILPSDKREFCAPEGVTIEEATHAMVQKLRESPNLQKWSYTTAAVLALKFAYPCER